MDATLEMEVGTLEESLKRMNNTKPKRKQNRRVGYWRDNYHTEKRQTWRRNYVESGKQTEYGREWRKRNKEKIKEGKREKICERYSRYKGNAKIRKLEWNLNKSQFVELVNGTCYYCGEGGKVGIDRKNNNLGYTFENCVPCHEICNRMKLTQNVEDFLIRCRKIASKWPTEPR